MISIDGYRLERVLGTGTFATVWLAHDEGLDATVAIKILADNWSRNDEVRRRFVDEARLLRRIDDERVVPVYTVNELADGRPFFVMAWADRGTLLDRIDERRAVGGFDWAGATRVALGILDCLTVVHAHGVVHRDLKPSNVLLRSAPAHHPLGAGQERIMLGDFGLAKDKAAGSGFTVSAGTPAYMAPEQAQLSADLDGRADLFAVTALYYELLTGHVAFEGDTLDDVRFRQGRGPAPLAARRSGLPAGLQEVVDRGLALNPTSRFATATEMAVAISAVTGPGGGALTVDGGGSGRPVRLWSERSPAVADIPPAGPLDAVAALIAWAATVVPDVTAAAQQARDRLGARMRIAVVGEAAELPSLVAALEDLGAVWTYPPGVWPADADAAVIVGAGPWPEPTGAATRRSHGGPSAVIAVGAIDGADNWLVPAATFLSASESASVAAWLGRDARSWWPHRRAAGALRILEAAFDTDEPTAVDLAAHIERVRLTYPGLAAVQVLCDEAAGRLRLPADARRELRRVLVGTTNGERLGLGASDAGELRTRASEGAARWRRALNNGQVPFGARAGAAAVARAYDRIAAGG